MKFNPDMCRTISPPIAEARRWIKDSRRDPAQPLIDLSQAAPVDLPALSLRRHISDLLMKDPRAHAYGPVLGMPELREEISRHWSELYGGKVSPRQVALTSGCNQAFTAAIAALARRGDAIMITSPMYFNHKMCLDMLGIEARLLEVDQSMLPSLEAAEQGVDSQLRAIVLITPNNPTGAQYPPVLVRGFFELARRHGLALIVDETYRDFVASSNSLHDLFQDDFWDGTLVHLYSFSKAYRLTGHRLGALVASHLLLHEIEKYMDTVAICANQIAQHAALFGLRNLQTWLERERTRISGRQTAIEIGFDTLGDWRLMKCGAYFAYVRHPFGISSEDVVRQLLDKESLLVLPDTMFAPRDSKPRAVETGKHLRIAFANVDKAGISDFFRRIDRFRFQ